MQFSDEERVHYVLALHGLAWCFRSEDLLDLHDLAAPVVTATRAGTMQHFATAAVGALHDLRLLETTVIDTAPFARARLGMFSFGVGHS